MSDKQVGVQLVKKRFLGPLLFVEDIVTFNPQRSPYTVLSPVIIIESFLGQFLLAVWIP